MAERPRPLRLACYLFGADGTAYPRHLVTHYSPAQRWDIPEPRPAGGTVDFRSCCALLCER
jgi:hypothetical protein